MKFRLSGDNEENMDENNEPLCKACKKPLTFCPMCGGNDPTEYASLGQDGTYYVCQDRDCEEYQFCCGC